MPYQEIIPPGGASDSERLRRIDALARLMDSQFDIGGVRLGLDPLLGLLPVIGDSISACISLLILFEARELGAPWHLQWRMGFNIFVDWFIGSIPILGDAFDVAWKANNMNVDLLRRHLEKKGAA